MLRSYLPYLVIVGLIGLALVIVLTKPQEQTLFGFDLDQLRDEAQEISPDSVKRSLEQWTVAIQDKLPSEAAFAGGILLAVETYDLTLDLSVRLQGKARFYNEKPLLGEIDEMTSEACRTPKVRRLLEAGLVLAIAYEDEDGVFIRHHLLRKESCRT